MSVAKGPVVLVSALLVIVVQVLQCRGLSEPQPRPSLAEDSNAEELGLASKTINLLLVVQSQGALYSLDPNDVKQPPSGDLEWTIDHLFASKITPVKPCPIKSKSDDYIEPDSSLVQIWPYISSKDIVSSSENIENEWLKEKHCVLMNKMYSKNSRCYDPDHSSFARCYYQQVEQLFYRGTATSQDIPIINGTLIPKDHTITPIMNVSEYVQKQLEALSQHYNNQPIHRLTPDMVKDYTDGRNVYLGCQQKAMDTFTRDSPICTITRVGLCFRCNTSGKPFSCDPTPSAGKYPPRITSCSNIVLRRVPWAGQDLWDVNKEYSCYDTTNCPFVQLWRPDEQPIRGP